MIELVDTDASQIASAFLRARTRAGSPAMGMVMTLVVVSDPDGAHDAMAAARHASHEHPARVLVLVVGDGRGAPTVDAQVSMGEGWGGESAVIRLSGPVVKHAGSVVMPLLLPDSPVVAWWPKDPPADPAGDPVGSLADRRITDAAAVTRGKTTALERQCAVYAPGDTDLAWTRITSWRALLAAAVDQRPGRIRRARVGAERISPSADLLQAWLVDRLRIDVTRETSKGPGITEVDLETRDGPISISRTDGRLATIRSPGSPDRPIALKRRDVPELLAEELRHLDEDEVYAATVRRLGALHRKAAQGHQ